MADVDEAWKQLPCAAVMVCASVLGPSNARAQEPTVEPDASVQPDAAPVPIAPTCGPACHNPNYVHYQDDQPLPDPEPDPTAPTCGPSCHGGDDPPNPGDVMPPPVEPAKKGCAVEDVDDLSPLGLAALSLGLLAGVAARRRRDHEP
jgi:MYXO-CTERM domain-containing protein